MEQIKNQSNSSSSKQRTHDRAQLCVESNILAYIRDVSEETGIPVGTLNSRFYKGLRGSELRKPVANK